MPFDGDESFFERGGYGVSLATILKRLGVNEISRGTFVALKIRELQLHDASWFYYNRYWVKGLFIGSGLALMYFGLAWAISDIVLSVILTIIGISAFLLSLVFRPTEPANWTEFKSFDLSYSRVPADTQAKFNNIRKILPSAIGIVGRLHQNEFSCLATYLIVKHENEEAIIGFWEEET